MYIFDIFTTIVNDIKSRALVKSCLYFVLFIYTVVYFFFYQRLYFCKIFGKISSASKRRSIP